MKNLAISKHSHDITTRINRQRSERAVTLTESPLLVKRARKYSHPLVPDASGYQSQIAELEEAIKAKEASQKEPELTSLENTRDHVSEAYRLKRLQQI